MTITKCNHRNEATPFENLFDGLFSGLNFPEIKSNTPVNIKETNDNFQVEVIAPGLEKKDFKINVAEHTLTISAEIEKIEKDETEKEIKSEYRFQSFTRSFHLDEKINANEISAEYNNGVLLVTLPKKPEVKPEVKQIEVK